MDLLVLRQKEGFHLPLLYIFVELDLVLNPSRPESFVRPYSSYWQVEQLFERLLLIEYLSLQKHCLFQTHQYFVQRFIERFKSHEIEWESL